MIQTPFYRLYQFTLKIAAYFLGIHEPRICSDVDAIKMGADILKEQNLKKPLLVTDKIILGLGYLSPLEEALKEKGFEYVIFSDVVANPTIENVEAGLKVFLENKCDSIIAVGGGSSLDCAKVIGARANNPKKTVEKMKGILHVRHKMPYFIAVPTTAGTGSETTLAAVIVNEKTHHKYAINDPHLIPNYALHDPRLLINLPGKITSTTGMDALTHAVEAYIGRSNTRKTKKAAIEAIKLIHKNLYKSYDDPKNFEYRMAMQRASYLAGVAFTRAYVGYVHALAHALGGKYNVPHGLANAIILPYVLESFGKSAEKKLAKLSDEIALCAKDKTNKEKAQAFIEWIRLLNRSMDIPEQLDIEYEQSAVDEMVNNAIKEGNPLYPVPKEFEKKEFEAIYRKVLK